MQISMQMKHDMKGVHHEMSTEEHRGTLQSHAEPRRTPKSTADHHGAQQGAVGHRKAPRKIARIAVSYADFDLEKMCFRGLACFSSFLNRLTIKTELEMTSMKSRGATGPSTSLISSLILW